jgi:suppressor for copper-sensitivity B
VKQPILQRWAICFFAAIAWCALSEIAPAQFNLGSGSSIGIGPGARSDIVKTSAYFTAPQAGKPAMLFVTAEIAPDWHIYSLTQPVGGPVKSKLKITASPDFKLTSEFKPLDPPAVHHYDDIWPGLPVEEYEKRVTWGAPIEIAAGVDPSKLQIAGAVNAQACAKECIAPQDYKFVARLGSGEHEARLPPAQDAGKTAAVSKDIGVGAPQPNSADSTGSARYQPAGSQVTLTGVLRPGMTTPGSVARLIINADPTPGWHIYALADKDPHDISEPTLIVMTEMSGLRVKSAQPDRAPIEVASNVKKSGKEQYYDRQVSWTIDVEVPRDTKPGNYPLTGIIGFQTCDKSSCDRPRAAWFNVNLTVGDKTSDGPASVVFRQAEYHEAAELADKRSSEPKPPNEPPNHSQLPVTPVNPQPGSSAPPPLSSNTDAGGFDEALVARNVTAEDSVVMIVLSAFFGGMLLNLMPCVFPVIGLKLLSFVEQSHHDRRRLLILNGWYSAGVVAVFLALAAVAVLLREQFHIDFKFGNQNGIQGYAIGMAAVMFVMGLSLLGVWEIPIPGFLGSGTAAKAMAHEGASGAFAKGAITTLLGASCSAPVVAVAFTFALDRGTAVWATFGTFALIGLGMASPYLILGANPKLVRFLPKPGVWMETFKHICGFVLLGAMVWVLTWLKMPYVAPTVAFLVGLWAACWWIGGVPLTEPLGKRLQAWGWGIAIAGAVGLFAFSWLAPAMAERFQDQIDQEVALAIQASGQPTSPTTQLTGRTSNDDRLPWQPFSKGLLKQLTRERRTVMVDFTADWCPNCKWLDRWVLNTAPVKEVVARNSVVPLVADYTDIPPELTEMLSLLKAGAVPVLAIFPAQDPNRPIVFRNGYTSQMLIDALDKAGASQSIAQAKETAMK